MKSRPWILAVGLWLCCSSAGQAASAEERWPALLQQWIGAVADHTPAESDQSVATISAWSRADLELARPWIQRLALFTTDRWDSKTRLKATDVRQLKDLSKQARDGRDGNDFVKRAALLHTDIVLLQQANEAQVPAPVSRVRAPRTAQSPPSTRVLVRAPDGLFDGYELGSLHWDYARDLLDAVAPSPAQDATVAIWYRTIAAHFAEGHAFGEALPHLARGRAILPDDPGLLFADGCRQETLGSAWVQEFVRAAALPNGLKFLDVSSAPNQLRQAEHLLQLTLAKDPAFTEARLHLARVLDAAGRHADALEQLRQVTQQTGDRVLLFYASLFTGDAERALGHDAEARVAYEKAIGFFPRAQSARLALSHLERSRGDRQAAVRALLPAVTREAANRDADDDPWSEYYSCDGRLLESWIKRLRAPFVKAGPR